MSVHVLSWVLKRSPESVSGRRLVLVVLADHAGDDGGGAYPSVQTIGHEAKLRSRRSVQRALRALEHAGAITPTGRSEHDTTTYRVLMDGSAADSAAFPDSMFESTEGSAATARGGEATAHAPSTAPEPSISKSSPNGDDAGKPAEVDDFMKVADEPEPEPLFEAKTVEDGKVDQVWAHHCEVNSPVNKEMSPSQKRMIQRVLKECTVEEACIAIDGNRASPWHRERGKHSLSDIFKPNYSRRETIRQRVDRFIQDAQRAGKGPAVPSVDRGKVQRHKDNVIQGGVEGAADQAKRLAQESRQWLEANGWQVEFIDGWPRFTERDE